MRSLLALAVALVALVGAGLLWTRDRPVAVATEAAPAAEADGDDESALVAPVSNVTPADREARRFERYDKDKDTAISQAEYLASRQRAFARLDSDGDGKLGFDEYAVATVKKFSRADRDADGRLKPDEIASTAPKRSETPKCECAS